MGARKDKDPGVKDQSSLCGNTGEGDTRQKKKSGETTTSVALTSVTDLAVAILYPPHRSRRENNRMPFRRTAPGEINNRVPTVRSPS